MLTITMTIAMTQSNDRLDRIERILESVANQNAELATRNAELATRQAELAERQEQFQVEMDANHEYIGSELGQLINGLTELKQQVSALTTQVDESVRQADLDRQLFSRSVERMIDILTTQFGSNGHNE